MAAGFVKVKMLDSDGKPISGFSKEDTGEIIGNEIQRIVSWKNNQSLHTLPEKQVRLKFYLKDADLFSFKSN